MTAVGWVAMFETWLQRNRWATGLVAAGECSAGSLLPDDVEEGRTHLPHRVSEKRAVSFAMGRGAARNAGARLGLAIGPLTRRPNGAPAWPAGVVGVIAHTTHLGVALVANAAKVSAVGLDVERRQGGREIENLVAFGSELEWLTSADGVSRDDRLLALFSAKESVFKAFSARTDERFGFEVARLTPKPDGTGFIGRFVDPIPAGLDEECSFTVEVDWIEDLVLTWMVLERTESRNW